MDYPLVTPQQLANHLRSLRRAQHLSQTELGKKMGLTQGRIGKIERDPRTVSIGQLMRMLALLGARFALQVPEARPPNAPPPRKDIRDR
jgi:HTH-type transcriptional regulator / antitoxin HipB